MFDTGKGKVLKEQIDILIINRHETVKFINLFARNTKNYHFIQMINSYLMGIHLENLQQNY